MAKARFLLKRGLLIDYALILHPTAPVRRFLGVEIVERPDGRAEFRPTGLPFEVDMMPEYALHVADGTLEVADAETAALCGVAWELPAASVLPDSEEPQTMPPVIRAATITADSAPAGHEE